jgi:hypothetical protein
MANVVELIIEFGMRIALWLQILARLCSYRTSAPLKKPLGKTMKESG